MSSFIKAAALAASTAICTGASADTIAAALTPPLPTAPLPSPELSDTVITFTTLPTPAAPTVPEPDIKPAEIVARQANISNFGTACGPSLDVNPAKGAMLDVSVSAPCLPSSAVTVTHEGLSFTAHLSMTGDLTFAMPAMSHTADVTVRLSDDAQLSATAYVPQVGDYARVALQWDGADPGSLVAQAPKVLTGQMYKLGAARGAEDKVLHVFSRRVDDLTDSGVVRLSLRAGITPQNCSLAQSTRVHRAIPGEPVTAYDLQINAPGCDAVGQSLELKNVMRDLKLTAK